MRAAVFSTKPYDRTYLGRAAAGSGHDLDFFEARLTHEHAPLAAGYAAVCAFVHDELQEATLRELAAGGTELVALRAAGFNNVDLEVARAVGIRVGRVPAYSPHAVAEHAVALILGLVRRTHRAYNRVRATSRLTGSSATTSTVAASASSAPVASGRSSPAS